MSETQKKTKSTTKTTTKAKKTTTKKSVSEKKVTPKKTTKTVAKKTTTKKEKTVTVKKELPIAEIQTPETTIEATETPVEASVQENSTPIVEQESEKAEEQKTTPKGFFSLYISTWKKYFSIKGRANRSEVFAFFMFNMFISLLLSLGMITAEFFFINETVASVLNTAGLVFAIISIPPSICLYIRRFHDFNKSALFAFFPYLLVLGSLLGIAIVNMMIPVYTTPIVFISMAVLIITITWALMYFFRWGNKGANSYGEQPLTKKRVTFINILLFILNIILYTPIAVLILFNIQMELYLNEGIQRNNLFMPEDFQLTDEVIKDDDLYPSEFEGLTDEELMLEIKKTADFINSVPAEPTVEKKEFIPTPTEKNLLKTEYNPTPETDK